MYCIKFYLLSISGSSATVVRTIRFKGITRAVSQSWIASKHLFIPYGTRGNGPKKTKVGVWRYPLHEGTRSSSRDAQPRFVTSKI